MANFVFPGSDLSTGSTLFDMLGSFWNSVYGGVDFVDAYSKGLGLLAMQTFNNVSELAKTASRLQIPVFHKDKWNSLILKESDRKIGQIIKFGDGTIFGYQPTGVLYHFGVATDQATRINLPNDNLKDVSVICNRLTDTSLALIKNVDYIINSNGEIIFRSNPFTDKLIYNRPIFDTTNRQVDKEITLWLFRPDYDKDYIHTHFGYVLGVQYDSSQNYKDFINSLFDGITGGTSLAVIQNALQAITDIPLVKEDNETVEHITNDHSYKLIITDKNVYRFKQTVTPIVEIGDVVNTGDALIDSLRIYRINAGQLPDASELPSITVPKAYLQLATTGDLTFSNSIESVTVTTDTGYTKITFPLTGLSGDITAFWNAVHANGIAANQTLAHLLDTRTIKIGEPDATALPATINPAQFLVSNVFRNNLIIVRLKSAHYGQNALGDGALTFLRKIIPSHTAVLIRSE